MKSLAKGPLVELYTDFARPLLMEILYKDVAKRFVAEIWPRGLLHRSCQESEFVQTEISYREFAKRS